MTWIGIIALSKYGSNTEVGIFGVASRLSILIGFILLAVNASTASKIAVLYMKKELREIKRLLVKTSFMMGLAVTPIMFVVAIAASEIMSAFGEEFSDGGAALIVLVAGQLIVTFIGAHTNALIMIGAAKVVKRYLYIALLTDVIACFVLIPVFGLVGAATATTISLILLHALSASWIFRNLDRRVATN